MIFWIVDISTENVLSGGLRENQVSQFIGFNTVHYPLENLIVRSNNGEEWSAAAWQRAKG